MNNNYKYLIWSGTAALAIFSVFLLVSIQHLSETSTTTNTIAFTGEGKVSAKPDLAMLNFSILTQAATSKAAQDDNSKKSQKVVAYLKSQGIADKDIKTSGYNVYPQYSSNTRPCPVPMMEGSTGTTEMMAPQSYPSYPCVIDDTQKITSYQVSQNFDVKVRDLDKVGTLLDGLVSQGANQVNNLGFQIENQEKLKDQARQMAITDAKNKARALQSQLGIGLGRIVNYYEGGNFPYYAMDKMGMGGGGEVRSGPSPSIPAGENEIIMSVTITYQIR
jgi:uncharacterized protein YggE